MKKVLFTLLLAIAFTGISFAQTESVKTDSTKTDSPQVEFYSSEEEFNEKNPSYLIHLTIMLIVNEVDTIVLQQEEELYKEEEVMTLL